jgi:glycerophosphoryl diester phosphodiesterase
MTDGSKVLAHRGGPLRAPENTMAAFKQAVDDGADGFECDVVLTRDGEPVVIHKSFYSDSISTLVDQKGKLKDLDWKMIRELRTEGERIPHLHDVLAFLNANQLECFIEPKAMSGDLVTKVVAAVSEFGVVDQVRLITFYRRRALLLISKKLNPQIKTSVILVWPFGGWANKARKAGANIVVPGWKGFAHWKDFNHLKLLSSLGVNLKEKVAETKSGGIPVYSGIADGEEAIDWLCSLNVDGIFTNDVRLTKRVVSSFEA